MSIVTQLSKKGQILIPRLLRKKIGFEPGKAIQLIETERGLLVKPVPKDPVAAARGFLKGPFSLTHDLLRERRREIEKEKKS